MHYTFMFSVIVVGTLFGLAMFAVARHEADQRKKKTNATRIAGIETFTVIASFASFGDIAESPGATATAARTQPHESQFTFTLPPLARPKTQLN